MYVKIHLKTSSLNQCNSINSISVFAGCPSSCFPAATGLAASFDKELAQLVGDAMGNEARAKGYCHDKIATFSLRNIH